MVTGAPGACTQAPRTDFGPRFWPELARLKVEVWRRDEGFLPIPCVWRLDGATLFFPGPSTDAPPRGHVQVALVKVFNNVGHFHAALSTPEARNTLLQSAVRGLGQDQPTILLACYIDVTKRDCVHWTCVATPVWVLPPRVMARLSGRVHIEQASSLDVPGRAVPHLLAAASALGAVASPAPLPGCNSLLPLAVLVHGLSAEHTRLLGGVPLPAYLRLFPLRESEVGSAWALLPVPTWLVLDGCRRREARIRVARATAASSGALHAWQWRTSAPGPVALALAASRSAAHHAEPLLLAVTDALSDDGLLPAACRHALTTLARCCALEVATVLVVKPGEEGAWRAAARVEEASACAPPVERWWSRFRPRRRSPAPLPPAPFPLPPAADACASKQDGASMLVHISLSPLPARSGRLVWEGWEANESGRMGPRGTALPAPPRDSPEAHARSSTAIIAQSLHLMRWRAAPDVDVPLLASIRVLILGAGTLGCAAARMLLPWGVRRVTFVDNGVVKPQNPGRQCLYSWSDAMAGLPKAKAAAAALARIHPGLAVDGVQLEIPMPGHPEDAGRVHAAVGGLASLFATHDVVLLLTDNRESRWLPTLMASTADLHKVVGGAPAASEGGGEHRVLAITVALGFDQWVVTRHGPPIRPSGAPPIAPRIACYFCADPVAPRNSVAGRELDQQCSITRPGNAYAAASAAVELLVALVHHPLGLHAPPDCPRQPDDPAPTPSPLGIVPHSQRGYLSHATTVVQEPVTSYDRCTACGERLVAAFTARGAALVADVCNADAAFLDRLAGLQSPPEGCEEEGYMLL
jgi:hypothetical protein